MVKKVNKSKKTTEEKFGTVSILPGIVLKTEPKSQLNSPVSMIARDLYQPAKKYAKTQFIIDRLSKLQKERKEEIINTVKKHDGLRGITSEEDKFSLTVFPSEKITWDNELLKKSLTLVYPMAVKETTTISVSVPLKLIANKKEVLISGKTIERTIRKSLIGLGIPQKELTKLMKKDININVDEEILNEMIKLHQVELLPGTRESEITWKIRANPL